jgi:hypothetical protein
MPRGWDAFVYRTDVDPKEYVGFFYDKTAAESWIKRHEGTYEVSDERPKKKSAEEADQ